MENGETFGLEDISDGFFPQETGADGSDFNWADDFLSSAESQDNTSTGVVQQQNLGLATTNFVPQTSQLAPVASGQYVVSNQANQMQVSNAAQGIQFVQPIQNVASAASLPNIIGSNAQLVRGPNGQLILKTLNNGPIQVQQSPQTLIQNQIVQNIQGAQPSFQQGQTQVIQPGQGQIQQLAGTVLTRNITPAHPSPAASPLISRSQTPASSPHVSRSLTPSQATTQVTSSRVQPQGNPPLFGNIAGSTNLNVYQIPVQGNTTSPFLNKNVQIQSLNQGTNLNAGAINVQGQALQGLVQSGQGLIQGSQGQALIQGQGQTAVLQGQGQNIVNTQNTVIQNPNVVNLNVAHVLCNSNLQNQSGTGAVQQMTPGLQGTLIQTSDGKNYIIQTPSQNIPASQSINLQQLLQPQLNVAQQANSGNSGLLQTTTVLGGLGNLIRLAPNQTVVGQDKNTNNNMTAATHFIGVNQQGQQVLIQRAPVPSQQQNIVVRALAQPNVVQLQQPAGSSGNNSTSQYQPNILQVQNPVASAAPNVLQVQQTATSGGIVSAASQTQFQTSTSSQIPQQQILMTPQQQGIRIVTGSQGQPVKIVGQPTVQATIPMTLNLQNLQGNQFQAIQLLQQQANSASKNQNTPSSTQTLQMNAVSANVLQPSTSQIKVVSSQQVLQQQQDNALFSTNANHISVNQSQNPHVAKLQQTGSVQPMLTSTSVQGLPISQNSLSNYLSITTASSTAVTSTVTPSVAMSTGSIIVNGTSQVVCSAAVVSGQPTLQARNCAPRLQTSSIHLPPELQKKLHQVQAEIVKIAKTTGPLSQEIKEKSRALLDMRRRILAQGQISAQQQTQPAQTVQQMLLNKKTDQTSVSNSSNQNHEQTIALDQSQQQLLGQGQQIKSEPQISLQSGNQIFGLTAPQNAVRLQQVVPGPSSGHQPHGHVMIQPSQGQVASQPSLNKKQGILQVNTALPGVTLSNVVQVSPSMTFGGTMTTVQQTSTGNISALGNIIEKSSADTTTQVTGAIPSTVTQNQNDARPNSSTQVAVPTQIKIGNHILNLNLTPSQKEKVEGYLSKMSPEQQQQQIAMFLKLQQQQQYQAQVQAQVKAQQNKLLLQQQQKVVTQTSDKTGNVPLTVISSQKAFDNNPALMINTPGKTPVMLKRVSVAAIPKSQLIHQQMNKDQENALKPDTKSPFRNRKDTYRRLLRYHVYQSKHPPTDVMEKDEEMFENMAEGIVRKSDFLFEKFRILLLKESMRENHTAEMVMIQRLLNDDLKERLQSEKKMAMDMPELFQPLPMSLLVKKEVKEEGSATTDEFYSSVKQEKVEDMEVQNLNSPNTNLVKSEESTSRPTTPKVKLVIRNDGQKFTSTITETNDSDTEENSNDQNSGPYTDIFSNQDNEIDIETTESRSPLLNSVKAEVDQVTEWSDISNEEKPFAQYMDSDSVSEDMNQNSLHVGATKTNSQSSSNVWERADIMSKMQNNTGDIGMMLEESDQAVHGLLSTDDLEEYGAGEQSFHSSSERKSFHHSLSYSSDVQLSMQVNSQEEDMDVRETDTDCSKNFPLPNSMTYSQSTFSESNLLNSMNDSAANFTQSSQYEMISSPEEDQDNDFFTHKLDLSYSVGDQKLPFSQGSSFSSQAQKRTDSSGVIEIADNNDTSTDSSDDSEDEDEDEDDDDSQNPSKSHSHPLNSQVQSAIDSILSLDNDSSSVPLTSYSDQSHHFMQQDYESSQSEHSTLNSPQTEENDQVSMDDDLDAAVQSILM